MKGEQRKNADIGTSEPVIGLEVHARLKTRTKAFCRCLARYGDRPNVHVCPVCLGYPGALPVVNRRMIDMAVMLGHALEAEIHPRTKFARKSYFYPDLPKGYQITQFETPLWTGGRLPLDVSGSRIIRLKRIHIEEDAGKSFHSEERTLVDFNRCGVPLVEIVTEPELRIPREAGLFLAELRRLVRWLDICDGNMEEGSLRCDANISLRREDDPAPGTKVEVKNMNSIRGVVAALECEFERQRDVLRRGGTVRRETRLWNENSRTTAPMRSKEEEFEYRCFPEPDLPPLDLDPEFIERQRKRVPELPLAMERRFVTRYQLPRPDAALLTVERRMADYFEETVRLSRGKFSARTAANWIRGEVFRLLKENEWTMDGFPVGPSRLAELLELVEDGRVSTTAAKEVLAAMLDDDRPPIRIAGEMRLEQVGDWTTLREIASEIIESYPEQVENYRKGKTGLLGFFIGQAMKREQGRLNPEILSAVFRELLRSPGGAR